MGDILYYYGGGGLYSFPNLRGADIRWGVYSTIMRVAGKGGGGVRYYYGGGGHSIAPPI